MGCRASTPALAKPPTWNEIVAGEGGGYYSDYSTPMGAAESKEEEAGDGAPSGRFWTSDRTAEVPVRYAAKGVGSEAHWPARTIGEVFAKAARESGARRALCVEDVGPDAAPEALPLGDWKTRTYAQYYDECRRAGQAFIQLGLARFDSVAIFGFNSPEWIMAEMACILAGGIAAGVYPTDTPDQVQYKAHHSGAVVAVVENAAKAEMFLGLKAELPKLQAIVVWSGAAPTGTEEVACMTWDELVGDVAAKASAAAESGDCDTIDKRIAEQKPGNCCAYIYTSGTTGAPKAVMISHDNILWEAQNAASQISGMGVDDVEGDRIISYLPLSHVAGMMVDIVCPVLVTAYWPGHTTVYFARPTDLKKGTIVQRLQGIQPTLFLGVPRVWEKIMEKMQAAVAANPPTGAKLKVARWAKAAGLRHQREMQLGGPGTYACCYGIAEKKVQAVVKARLGLTHCKFGFTGAAPIKVETLEYFGALGLQINEVYGMSECTGATTWSTDEAHKWGSCGWPLNGQQIKIWDSEKGSECPRWDPATGKPTETEQGEVCYRGRHIMMGYMANPDLGAEHVAKIAAKNKEAIDDEGWLHSGDKGVMDTDGMVRITGRYKELIIGAGGENIAPVPVEDAVKSRCPAISNIMMVGDKRKFNVALVTLKAFGTGELPGGTELEPAAQLVPGVKTIAEAQDNEAYIAMIRKAISDTNADGAAVTSNAAKIQKFTILPQDFSVQTGELTPTFKLKRSVAEGMNTEIIEAMYASKEVYVRHVAGGAGGAAAGDVQVAA